VTFAVRHQATARATRCSFAVCAGLATIGAFLSPALGAERPFPTLVVLGAAQPIQTTEGLYTPIVVIDHESAGWYGEGRLNATLHTSEANAAMTHRIEPWLDLTYQGRLRVTTEGDGRDLYRDGNRDSAGAFLGNSEALIGAARFFPERPWRFGIEIERLSAQFAEDPATRPGFDLPSDFQQTEFRAYGTRMGLWGVEDGEITVTFAEGERQNFQDWQLDRRAAESKSYTKVMLHGEQPIPWNDTNRGQINADILSGDDLDLFSGYPVGGLGGRYPVGGYFRNEFRASQAAVLNLSHEHRFEQDRRLSFYVDAARIEETETALPVQVAEWRSLASVGVGYYYGIRSLLGLPVIVRYAEALLVPGGSKEEHRREVLLVLAAGF
jgi:hypothetical protein